MAHRAETLTEREAQVLRLLLAGHTAKSAARELDLSVHTVNDYLREARKKLGVGSSKEAARALAQYEGSPPNSLGPAQIGNAPTEAPQHNAASTHEGRTGLPWPWVIGGFAMIATAIIALAMMGGTPNVTPASHPAPAVAQDTRAKAERLARDWIALVDAGQWAKSWEQAGPTFRDAVTAKQWGAQVEPVRKPLGAVVSRQLKAVTPYNELPGAPSGDYLVVQFDTNYAAAPGAVETIVLEKTGSGWGVTGYFIK